MGGSKSQSSSSSQTRNISEDNRVVGSDGTTLGKGANFSIINELPETVVEVFSEFIQLSKSAGQGIVDITEKSLDVVKDSQDLALARVSESANKSLSTATTALDRSTRSEENRLIADLFPILALGVFGIVAIGFFKK